MSERVDELRRQLKAAEADLANAERVAQMYNRNLNLSRKILGERLSAYMKAVADERVDGREANR